MLRARGPTRQCKARPKNWVSVNAANLQATLQLSSDFPGPGGQCPMSRIINNLIDRHQLKSLDGFIKAIVIGILGLFVKDEITYDLLWALFELHDLSRNRCS